MSFERVKNLLSRVSPRLVMEIQFYHNFHRRMDLKNPKDINEKLQYLKLKDYYNNPLVTAAVDKYKVRAYLEERGLGRLLPELYGALDRAEELRALWPSLPERFVLKCNHGSGYNIMVEDKSKTSLEDCVRQLDAWMKEDYWTQFCELQYVFVPKKIVVEEHLGADIHTYKFYCFHGVPEAIYISTNGEDGEHDYYIDYFDVNWKPLDITLEPHPHLPVPPEKPDTLEEMLEISRTLSKEFPFVRVDLYESEGKVYFSELTLIPTGGYMTLQPESVLRDWGDKLRLNQK